MALFRDAPAESPVAQSGDRDRPPHDSDSSVSNIGVPADQAVPRFLSAVLSAGGSSLICFPQLSAISPSPQKCSKRPKIPKIEKNNPTWDLTRMISYSAGRRFKPGGWLHVFNDLQITFVSVVSCVPHFCQQNAQFREILRISRSRPSRRINNLRSHLRDPNTVPTSSRNDAAPTSA